MNVQTLFIFYKRRQKMFGRRIVCFGFNFNSSNMFPLRGSKLTVIQFITTTAISKRCEDYRWMTLPISLFRCDDDERKAIRLPTDGLVFECVLSMVKCFSFR